MVIFLERLDSGPVSFTSLFIKPQKCLEIFCGEVPSVVVAVAVAVAVAVVVVVVVVAFACHTRSPSIIGTSLGHLKDIVSGKNTSTKFNVQLELTSFTLLRCGSRIIENKWCFETLNFIHTTPERGPPKTCSTLAHIPTFHKKLAKTVGTHVKPTFLGLMTQWPIDFGPKNLHCSILVVGVQRKTFFLLPKMPKHHLPTFGQVPSVLQTSWMLCGLCGRFIHGSKYVKMLKISRLRDQGPSRELTSLTTKSLFPFPVASAAFLHC